MNTRYPCLIQPGDIWITNCSADDVFDRLIRFQAAWLDHDVWADLPRDMSRDAHSMWFERSFKGCTQQQLMANDWWGIYRRPSSSG